MASEVDAIKAAPQDLRAIVITIGGRQSVGASPAIVLELGEMRIPGLAVAKQSRAEVCQKIIDAINPALNWAAGGSDCRILLATDVPPEQTDSDGKS